MSGVPHVATERELAGINTRLTRILERLVGPV